MTKILLTRSKTAGLKPTADQLQHGELFLNYADGVIYFKKSDGTIGQFSYDELTDAQIETQLNRLWDGYWGNQPQTDEPSV